MSAPQWRTSSGVPIGAPDSPAFANEREMGEKKGTSLSNVLSSTNAKLATLSFQPRNSVPAKQGEVTPTLSKKLAEAPVFVPRGNTTPRATSPTKAYEEFQLASKFDTYDTGSEHGAHGYKAPGFNSSNGAEGMITTVRHPLKYHLYAPPTPHVSNFHPSHLASMTFFMDPMMHESLLRKQDALCTTQPEQIGEHLPEILHLYHHLVPLEPGANPPSSALMDPRFFSKGIKHGLTGASGDPSRIFGHRTSIYKATCVLDGKSYVLRRIENFRPANETSIQTVERWRKIRHPSIVAVREAFTSLAFGDHSVVFVYDYHPLATTLYMEHMTVKPLQPDPRTGQLQPASMHVPERVLWSYLCQLSSLLRVIHAAGLAARSIEPSKVLRTSQNRIRLSGCAIFDVLSYQPNSPAESLPEYQQEDLVMLGKLILCTACNNSAAAHTVDASMDLIRKRYSTELADILTKLIDTHKLDTNERFSADSLVVALAPHLSDELGSVLNHTDLQEASMMRELENGRLVRLLCKLNIVQDRPEYEGNSQYTEHGDQYVLKLFRDMVFHPVDEHGRPVVDLSHILLHLNKLDAGIDERIMLTSRDELSCLVISYAEIRGIVESLYSAIVRHN
ncbi:PAB-dependent poly(A)-specific ribonuclease subunit 3 [Malassezia yamatoensis]|uniref:PAN2-PAN3 deadenylation complex subunit PAN3 n=1 Tax=Malassezia yamatoensis TaxID=253288 RepID=A0AAJ5YP28_9BASI|nr:PAB-dependent poly(A)-specific ribonuclease subunit 3 [Malassezia yamatoensis]